MLKHNTITAKMSSKGQIVIPADIRKKLNINNGDTVSITQNNDEVLIKKMPSSLSWDNLINDIPNEKVDIDKNGNYDPKKSPNFNNWMKER
ncbi:AbrB/MazE/SpoVT family DNA-binding domain-containing protein [Apilactobacillus micheneri]|uniref:AbrB/MazE/SpoVT family DNA-binding domain-containing protein n=1 Tax=Apilactobacillus micheneri TaxID=1899430 RepID=A0A9Q8IMC8_9LACO|nr:AbrB/MazE/SpoVT family DNA-binding domain-containing protein [Apilactobacillus micheneri]TPR40006.1 AbrB/MazE/SpoVT family DNA-binding domain-containing protein [Apilactobacillus micheneri]TPR41817.1 AbrB/MazE/SpoVT family DNA-binding domain-containing protein [Apilactobacillus micheneri]TPR44208.1 AbrB/MazE/SpoVT family DNA-binding domain-containing protein [Apilactobacillus micheneri]TPR45832.1 AbrB/MazE/SpoVT family DNA-binding domain-containing protein [Apilactobacillus micheneri]TPR505